MLYFSNLKDSVRLPSDEKNKRWMSKGWLNYWTSYPSYRLKDTYHCDQKKIPKCLWKLPKKLNHSKNDRFWYLNKNCLRMWGNLGKLIVAKGFKICPKSNKLPNLVTLVSVPTLSSPLHSCRVETLARDSRRRPNLLSQERCNIIERT